MWIYLNKEHGQDRWLHSLIFYASCIILRNQFIQFLLNLSEILQSAAKSSSWLSPESKFWWICTISSWFSWLAYSPFLFNFLPRCFRYRLLYVRDDLHVDPSRFSHIFHIQFHSLSVDVFLWFIFHDGITLNTPTKAIARWFLPHHLRLSNHLDLRYCRYPIPDHLHCHHHLQMRMLPYLFCLGYYTLPWRRLGPLRFL